MSKTSEVKLTRQHQITIPMSVCQELDLQGGDRLQIVIMPGQEMLLKPKKLIDANDEAYRLGREILGAEDEIKHGKVTTWADVKKRHRLYTRPTESSCPI